MLLFRESINPRPTTCILYQTDLHSQFVEYHGLYIYIYIYIYLYLVNITIVISLL